MEVKSEVLRKLVCSVCKEYLSVGPVLLLQNGKSVCGRCPLPNEKYATRMLPYEHLAENMIFPCRYKQHGCNISQSFAKLKQHEAVCSHKTWSCVLSANCVWRGPKSQLLQHCDQHHADQVRTNPVSFEHNLTQTSNRNFLMLAYNMLFLLHTKVCTQTRKIYHYVHLLGETCSQNYDVALDISNAKNSVIKKSDVSAYETDVQNDSLMISIDNLIGILGTAKGIRFKLSINEKIHNDETAAFKEMRCCECGALITHELAYQVNTNRWKCYDCVGEKSSCENCFAYIDTMPKLIFHRWYYCNYQGRTDCKICGYYDSDEFSLEKHYEHEHPELWRVGLWNEEIKRCETVTMLIASDVGVLHCHYMFRKSKFLFEVASSMPSGSVHFHTCVLELQNPVTGFSSKKIMPFGLQDSDYSWRLYVPKEEFALYVHDENVLLKVTVTKTK